MFTLMFLFATSSAIDLQRPTRPDFEATQLAWPGFPVDPTIDETPIILILKRLAYLSIFISSGVFPEYENIKSMSLLSI